MGFGISVPTRRHVPCWDGSLRTETFPVGKPEFGVVGRRPGVWSGPVLELTDTGVSGVSRDGGDSEVEG